MPIAQFNIARLRHPLYDRRSADFKDNLDRVNAAAKRMPGFLWVLEDATGSATSFRIDNDPQMLVNLSLWESLEDLRRFVFGPVHGHFMRRRAEWFEPSEKAQLVIWPIEAGAIPTIAEGVRKLERLRQNGPDASALGWPA